MNDLLGILIGLLTGAAMSVAVSCVWIVLLVPARIQDRLQAGSSCLMTWALCIGLILSALHNALGLTLPLPRIAGSLALLAGGMFVGMVASALGEILEVVPVLMQRFRLHNVSSGMRWVMLVGKGIGAVLASLAFTI